MIYKAIPIADRLPEPGKYVVMLDSAGEYSGVYSLTENGLSPHHAIAVPKPNNNPITHWLEKVEISKGIELIAEERQRQINVEGWTTEHDAEHTDEQLAIAACCYAYPPQNAYPSRLEEWPFDDESWKPSPENRIRELQKAGALIAAEIDRLQSIKL